MIVWIHGGGWLEGGRQVLPDTIEPWGFHSAWSTGATRSPLWTTGWPCEAQYPAQLRTCRRPSPGCAPRHRGCGSTRAAGHVRRVGRRPSRRHGRAWSVTTTPRSAPVVNWYGAVDLDLDDPDDPTIPPAMLLGGPIGGRRGFVRWASPLAAGPRRRTTVPERARHADTVVPYDQSERLTAALRAVGVRADLHPVPDAGHCFEGYADIGGLIERCLDFLDEVLVVRVSE